MMKIRQLAMTCSMAVLLFGHADRLARADDWPQWQGPDRTNVSKETGLMRSWPKDGPKLLWTFEKAGFGYSGPAIVGDRLYTMGGRDDTSYVFALDVKSGKEIWATSIGKMFKNSYGNGPRCTPTVDGDSLYALDAQGELICVETATGKKQWSVNVEKDLHGKLMSTWGYSESPLVDGNQVVCCPGGKDGTLAALDKKTGKVLWRSKELTDEATYSSLVVAEIGGVRQYIQLTFKKKGEGAIVGVAAKDGKLLWYYPRSDYQTAVIPTPIVRGNLVYAAVGYGAGCDLLQISGKGERFEAKQLYDKKKVQKNMDNKTGGVVLVGDYVYGFSDGRGWVCQILKTGEVKWENKSGKVERGSLTCADGLLYCYGENSGEVALVDLSPDALKFKSKFKIPRETKLSRGSGRIFTHPVVANGCLYLRDQDLIFCYDIRNHTAAAR
jgi:outer membrane protein assembly factor BamB